MADNADSLDHSPSYIHNEIDDDNFKRLKVIFNFAGRGRRPSLPKLTVNNRLLLQLYFLKEEKTWGDVIDFALNIVELDVKKSRIRALLEKTYRSAIQIQLTSDNLQDFLRTEFDSIGKSLSKERLTRRELLGDISAKRINLVPLTNAAVLELLDFQKKEDLPSQWFSKVVTYLSGQVIQNCNKRLKTLQVTARRKSQARGRNAEDYDSFMKEHFLELDGACQVNSSPLTPRTPGPPCRKRLKLEAESSNTICKQQFSDIENSPLQSASKAIQIKKLKGELETTSSALEEEQLRNKTLKQLLGQKETELNNRVAQLTKTEREVLVLQEDLSKRGAELEKNITSLQEKNKLLASIRHTSYYKRLKRWENKLRKKETDQEENRCSELIGIITSLKQKLRKSQTLLSNTRQSHKKLKEENVRLLGQIDQIKQNFLEDRTKATLKMREPNSNKFTKEVTICVMELIGRCEVSGKNCSEVINTVAKHLFGVKLDKKDLPSERTSIRFADKGHVLAKQHLADTLLNSSNVDLHSDGTSRDHNKVLGHQLSTDGGLLLSCGFTPVFKEDTETMVDVAFNLMRELADIYDDDKIDEVFKSMLSNLTGLMSDRASVMKSFDKSFNEQRQQALETDDNMEFLHCNAHFLLGLSTASEKVLKESSKNETFGRDNADKFKRFASSTESPAARFIRTACDILGPRGDEKNGCKDSWQAFCIMQDIKSTITSFRGNRFNNLFQAAAALHFHRADIIDFLKNYMSNLNLKQESVLLDADCDMLDSPIVALGIVYQKVTGPYWILMQREVMYLDFFHYVTEMNDCISSWANDASELMQEDMPPLFNIHVRSPIFPSLYAITESKKVTVKMILQQFCSAFKDVIGRQLADFLPGGRYHDVRDPEKIQRLKHSKITNLVGEECFGDLDFSIFKRRNASLHHHSTVNMLKRNKTFAWFDAKSTGDQTEILSVCNTKSAALRKKHQNLQKAVLQKRREFLASNRLEKEKKTAELAAKKRRIAENVKNHGGPCLSSTDVEKVLQNMDFQKNKLEAVREEIRYNKVVLGVKNPLLKLTGSLEKLTTNLKVFLGGNTSIEVTLQDATESETDSGAEDENDAESIAEKSEFGNFAFSKQGQNVAVFYDNDFYLGQVVSFDNEEEGEVKFMEKCKVKPNTFKWPSSENIETVSAIYVFDWGFEMSTKNGRIWFIDNGETCVNLTKKYKLYKELYC